MIDVRKLGQGVRRRLGAPSNHLAMAPKPAAKQTTMSVGQAKTAIKKPAQFQESRAMAEAGERSWAQDLARGK